jgi:hypothetical protein
MSGEQRVTDERLVQLADIYVHNEQEHAAFIELLKLRTAHRATEAKLAEALAEVERLKPLCDGYGKLDSDYAIMERDLAATKAKLEAAEKALRMIALTVERVDQGMGHYFDQPLNGALARDIALEALGMLPEPDQGTVAALRAALTTKETTDAN